MDRIFRDWELADTERANGIKKTNFLPGRVRTSSHRLVERRSLPWAPEDFRSLTVKLQRFLGVHFKKKKKFFIVVHSFVLQAFLEHLLVPGATLCSRERQ